MTPMSRMRPPPTPPISGYIEEDLMEVSLGNFSVVMFIVAIAGVVAVVVVVVGAVVVLVVVVGLMSSGILLDSSGITCFVDVLGVVLVVLVVVFHNPGSILHFLSPPQVQSPAHRYSVAVVLTNFCLIP